MFQRIHPFTSLGLLLMLVAPAFVFAGWPLVAVALLFTAQGLTLLEFKKYTSRFQFTMILLTALALGILLDLRHLSWPWMTTALLLAASAIIARQAFMQHFTYVNLLWLDTGMAVLGFGCFGMAVCDHAFSWDFWLVPLLPLVCAMGLTLSYVHDARHMRKRTRFGYRVQVGMEVPTIELPDQDGNMVKLADYRGKHPVLLIFVRGDWCPGCHMMLRTYERDRQRFLEKGVHVLGIGPDNIEVNRDMVQRIGVGYRMLSDDDQAVSAQFGVVYSNPVIELGVDYAEGIPLPASFLVDVNGIVRYVSRPDRVGEFLDPTLIFGVLEGLPATSNAAWT